MIGLPHGMPMGDHGDMTEASALRDPDTAPALRKPRCPGIRQGPILLVFALLAAAAWGQVPAESLPLDRIPIDFQAEVQRVLKRSDFTFQIATKPVKVRLATMDKLFDRPRLAAAMWRHCRFVPALYASESPGHVLDIDDARGLHGTLFLVHRQPGLRIYYIEGRVERGRMGNPMAVGAKMVVAYRYWESGEGFQTLLSTWTALDSAVLAVLTKPFRRYVRRRQEEFIAYINGNIALGGEFAQLSAHEFKEPIQREGDPIAIRQYREVFGN